ncbi:ankyrin repeat and zinc finger domain-containing protein 1-like isoform X2 [Acanthaster planci]|nr:ankyrin repeat and zinc finger domain-containing protein 1-like isoform X2 [Acanthaster planci]
MKSGSCTSDSPEPHHHVLGRRHPKVFFRSGEGRLVSVQRCVLHGKKDIPTTQQELIAMATRLPVRMKWLILMIGGGHFAGAIFDGKEVVVHKTFHRYTVRAKRGTAQGMRDSQQGGNQPKSAGASLRRYNEAALVDDIHALLASWDDQTKACHRIFMRAPSYNKNVFFGGKSPPLDRHDQRIVTIPFATRRPTYKEIQRVHDLLSTIECYGDAIEAERRIVDAHSPKAKQPKNSAKTKRTGENTENSTADMESNKEKPSADPGESEAEIDLVLVEEEISTLELQEFETNVKKSQRPKKKKKPKKKLENSEQDESNKQMDVLCEACRTGDWDQLKSLMIAHANGEGTNTGVSTTEEKSKSGDEGADQSEHTIKQDIHPHDLGNKTSDGEPEKKTVLREDGNKVASTGKDVVSGVPHLSLGSEDNVGDKRDQRKHGQGALMVDSAGLAGAEQGMLGNGQSMMGSREDMADIVNRPVDELGNTLLHVAVQAERAVMVWKLMEIGADPAIKNSKRQLPYVLCNGKGLRKEFRRFMAAHPGKYDYERAQVPSPLTSDREEMRAAKAAEKKKLQKKNKRIREKEQKEELKRQEEERKMREAEEEEKRRFAALSDREKRALAAERRFQAQLTAQGAMTTDTVILNNTKRCWMCGASLVGKVPFEYLDYKFCTIQCVKQHKQQQKTPTT